MKLISFNKNRFLRKPFTNIVFIFLLLTFFLILSGIYYYNFQRMKIVEERFDYLLSNADFRLFQIEEWLRGNYAELEVLKTSSPLTNYLLHRGFLNRNDSNYIQNWFEVLKKYYKYDAVILLDDKLNIILNESGDKFKISSVDSMLCSEALDSSSVQFSDYIVNTASEKEIKFYVPLKEKLFSSKNTGVLILIQKPQKIFNPILNNYIDKSQTIESLLVKSLDDSVFYLNNPRFDFPETGSLSNRYRKALIQTSEMKERKGFYDGVDYKNDEVIARIQKVPSTTWFLITKINKTEFYKPVNKLAEMVVLAVFSLVLLFALILFFIWRKNIAANIKKAYSAEIEKYKLESRFQSVVNKVKDIAIFILDRDGKVISWNEGAEKMEGYSSEEIVGKHFSIFYTEEEQQGDKPSNILREALLSGNARDEGWRIRKDNSTFWANVIITSLTDVDGEVYGFLNITHDLTEKRKAEEEIKRSRDFYLKLLDDFPNPVWRSDPYGKCNYCNKAWLNFTGRKIEQEIGNGWTENLHSEDRERVLRDYYDAHKKRINFATEFRLKNSHNEYRWVVDFGIPYYDFENKFMGYLCSCYDINDRKKYEETINTLLNISEKLYSSLEIDQISDSLVTESIKLTDAESGFAAIKTEEGFLSKRYYHLDHWEYFDKVYLFEDPLPKRFIAEKTSFICAFPFEDFLTDEDLLNKYNIKQILSTPLFGSAGELIGFFELHNKRNNKVFDNDDVNLLRGVAKNASISITKSLTYEKLRKTEFRLRSSESELRNLAAQIQYARETERQHIAREVHDELGQLLTGINLNISLLTEMLEQNEKTTVNEILDELHSVQKFVDKGIQTVRDISSSLRSYVLDHLGLIPAVREYCREIERISNIKCNLTSPERAFKGEGSHENESLNFNDEENVAIFRIIQEALTNVIRHAEATKIDIKVSQSQENLEIVISDNGKGMEQNHEHYSNSMGILGMKERAIFLGGKLNIESKKEKGTNITLLVPLRQKSEKV